MGTSFGVDIITHVELIGRECFQLRFSHTEQITGLKRTIEGKQILLTTPRMHILKNPGQVLEDGNLFRFDLLLLGIYEYTTKITLLIFLYSITNSIIYSRIYEHFVKQHLLELAQLLLLYYIYCLNIVDLIAGNLLGILTILIVR